MQTGGVGQITLCHHGRSLTAQAGQCTNQRTRLELAFIVKGKYLGQYRGCSVDGAVACGKGAGQISQSFTTIGKNNVKQLEANALLVKFTGQFCNGFSGPGPWADAAQTGVVYIYQYDAPFCLGAGTDLPEQVGGALVYLLQTRRR